MSWSLLEETPAEQDELMTPTQPPAPIRGSTDAETCRLNGWGVGTVLEGASAWSAARIRITSIGEDAILAVEIASDGADKRLVPSPCVHGHAGSDREAIWRLSCRDWRPVSVVPPAPPPPETIAPASTPWKIGLDDCEVLSRSGMYLGQFLQAADARRCVVAVNGGWAGETPRQVSGTLLTTDEAEVALRNAIDSGTLGKTILRSLGKAGIWLCWTRSSATPIQGESGPTPPDHPDASRGVRDNCPSCEGSGIDPNSGFVPDPCVDCCGSGTTNPPPAPSTVAPKVGGTYRTRNDSWVKIIKRREDEPVHPFVGAGHLGVWTENGRHWCNHDLDLIAIISEPEPDAGEAGR